MACFKFFLTWDEGLAVLTILVIFKESSKNPCWINSKKVRKVNIFHLASNIPKLTSSSIWSASSNTNTLIALSLKILSLLIHLFRVPGVPITIWSVILPLKEEFTTLDSSAAVQAQVIPVYFPIFKSTAWF